MFSKSSVFAISWRQTIPGTTLFKQPLNQVSRKAVDELALGRHPEGTRSHLLYRSDRILGAMAQPNQAGGHHRARAPSTAPAVHDYGFTRSSSGQNAIDQGREGFEGIGQIVVYDGQVFCGQAQGLGLGQQGGNAQPSQFFSPQQADQPIDAVVGFESS
jgi:hypothetical protein